MAKRQSQDARANSKAIALCDKPIATGADFAAIFAALLSDTITGRVDPRVSNAACNVGAKLLKAVELSFRYGRKVDGMEERVLALTPITPTVQQVQ